MSKQHVLTEQDVERYALNPEIVRYLEAFRQRQGLAPGAMRVLDFGCGRGEAVVQLRRLGYDAVGADIDPVALANGRSYMRSHGFAEGCLLAVDEEGHVDAPPGSFDFVFSETVFEHLRDLDASAREMNRLMATPSAALHAFPSRRHVVEQHLRMPFVHWLPKNALRTIAVFFFVLIGVEPRWEKEGLMARVRRYSHYSKHNTFYRSPQTVSETFERHGFRVDFVSVEHPKLVSHPLLAKLMQLRAGRTFLNWLVLNFKTVELQLQKPV